MASFNQVQFIGRLGKDPELTVTPNGKPVSKFSLAVDQGKDQKPMWLNVTAWEKLAEIVEKYTCKGMQVFVQGKLVMRPYKDKSGVDRQSIDIVANVVQMLDKKPDGGRPPTAADDGRDPFLPDFPDE